MEIPDVIGEKGYCVCGAYAEIDGLANACHFLERARKALGVEAAYGKPSMEVVDGGTLFEEKGEPVIIQWAKKPV